jgi:hypothetical protein
LPGLRSPALCWSSGAPAINGYNVLWPSFLHTNRKSALLASIASASGRQLNRASSRRDWAQVSHSRLVLVQPVLGGVRLRILHLSVHPAQVILESSAATPWYVRGQRSSLPQQGVITLALPVGSLAGKRLRAAQFLPTEILASIERHRCSPRQPLKDLQAVAFAQLLDDSGRSKAAMAPG